MEKFKNIILHPLSITLIVIIVGVGALFAIFKAASGENVNSPDYSERSWGKSDSKVVITEYADFQCPACGNFHETVEKKLKENYGDKIKFVYKHYPLNGIHPNAQRSAEASEAAAAQGKFWEFHDYLFENQSEATNWNTAKLVEYAKTLGLDSGRFEKELKEGLYKKAVRQTRSEATNAGYSGTPTVLFNGQVVSDYSYEALESKIKEILGEAAPTPTVVATATVAPTQTENTTN